MPDTNQAASGNPRRQFLACLGGLGIGTTVFHRSLAAQVAQSGKITKDMIGASEWIAGIELSDEEREDVASAIGGTLRSAQRLREQPVDADSVPALVFRPDFFYRQTNPESAEHSGLQVAFSIADAARRGSDEDLAFARVSEQASLLARKEISSRELTELYLGRLKKYDPLLKCVVTMLEEHALKQSDASDERRAKGETRGVLDGIPWLAKDLVAVPPWKTTWGAEPFKDQVRNTTATVAEKLEQAGAVLMAKVTLGALAWGDKWFGGTTRNPWNPEQGSSGSSAGSASAIAAGLASFALGSETLGSIVSPTRRCRTSGLRPTFGRVSRAGCMPLSWSMDKIGPIARHIEDLALVFPALLGQDGKDPTLVERGFKWPVEHSLKSLKVGVTGDRMASAEKNALAFLEAEGAKVVELDLTSTLPTSAMSFILGVEATTVFDDAFREDQNADYGLWPRTFREAQFTPAVQYLRANRMRSQMVAEAEEKFAQVDVVIGANDLLLTNLTGHPSIVVACGADKSRDIELPGVVKLTAAAYQESKLLHVGHELQAAMPPKPARPPLDEWESKIAEKAADE
ncbi:MAG: amidase [Planctomycetota bacterium]|nr:amidase [Planctomycetota bacterium]